jgi:hypothetical protein
MKEGDRTKRIIQIKKRSTILIRLIAIILILIREKIKLPEIRNFMFESISFDIIRSEGKMTIAIMNVHTVYIEIRNITDRSIIINRKRRLRIIEEYGIEGCYLVTEELKFLVIGRVS